MVITSDQIETICGIAHETSIDGRGISLHEALDLSHYRRLRSELDEAMVAKYLTAHPGVVSQWKVFSENKRTSGGWFLVGAANSWVVGRLGPNGAMTDERAYASAVEACAHFILAELDSSAQAIR